MRQQMEEEQWDLCRLLDAALHGRPAEMLPPAEKYEAILELADRHRVLPLLYDVLAPKLPEEDENRKRLEKRSAETVRQSYRLLFLGKYVTGLLREHGIETVLLKGSGTAGLYPVPELRKSGDIDLLVADQKAGEKAYEVLHEHGFRKASEQHAHHHRLRWHRADWNRNSRCAGRAVRLQKRQRVARRTSGGISGAL